jgi:prophage antirepressor-like protein
MQAEIQSYSFPITNQVTRIVDLDGEPWWVAKDVCEVLGLDEAHKAVGRLDDDERNTIPVMDSMGRCQKTSIINESGLYSLILTSRKPEAKQFKKWVTAEVLPTIRKTGSYQAAPIETQLNNPAALRGFLLSYTEKVLALEAQVAEQAPKVAALQRLEMADGSVCLTNAAKLLKVRPKDFFLHLQAKKWIYKRPGTSTWVAYQDRIQFGVLEMSEYTQTLPDGSEKLRVQTRITPKGLAKLSFEFNGADQQAN